MILNIYNPFPVSFRVFINPFRETFQAQAELDIFIGLLSHSWESFCIHLLYLNYEQGDRERKCLVENRYRTISPVTF